MQVYSDFFTSGLSNISESSHSSTSSHLMPSVEQGTKLRHHTTIPHIQHKLNLSALTRSTKNKDFDNTKRHRRVSSLLPKPSKKWFGNISRRALARLDPGGESSANNEVVENEDKNVQDPRAETLDPFSSSLDSTSYFIDKLDVHKETWEHQKHDVLTPIMQMSMHPFSHSASRYRERPISIQTSPNLQLASRRSSLQQWSGSSEKLDSFSLCSMWREDGPLSPSLPLENDSSDIDWREFHDSLLYND